MRSSRPDQSDLQLRCHTPCPWLLLGVRAHAERTHHMRVVHMRAVANERQ
jgi:hypothetical protein